MTEPKRARGLYLSPSLLQLSSGRADVRRATTTALMMMMMVDFCTASPSSRLLHFHVTSEKFTSNEVKVPKPDWLQTVRGGQKKNKRYSFQELPDKSAELGGKKNSHFHEMRVCIFAKTQQAICEIKTFS